MEGPFPVELHDGREEGWIAREACFGYDVLAGVVAFLGAGPEEEAVLEGLECVSEDVWREVS